jgi:hypothetical protein
MVTDNVRRCDYCQSPIETGQRWVREKIYDPQPTSEIPAYRQFHAEGFAKLDLSCWEKRELEKEMARIALRQPDAGRFQMWSASA